MKMLTKQMSNKKLRSQPNVTPRVWKSSVTESRDIIVERMLGKVFENLILWMISGCKGMQINTWKTYYMKGQFNKKTELLKKESDFWEINGAISQIKIQSLNNRL